MTTRIVDNRDAALRIGYSATDWSQPVSYDDYAWALNDWSVKTLERDGAPIGAVYTRGSELHLSILPEWRRKWATKEILKELFEGKLVTTRVADGHEYMHGILRRLGFIRLSDGSYEKGH